MSGLQDVESLNTDMLIIEVYTWTGSLSVTGDNLSQSSGAV